MHNVDGLDSSNGAVPRMLAARSALVATVGAADGIQAAEDAFESRPQQVGNNLHMSFPCSGSGCTGGVVFEYDGMAAHTDGFATVRAPGDVADGVNTADAIVCTNHYVKRAAPETSGSSYDRYQILVNGVNDAVTSGGLDVPGALALMTAAADRGDTPTIHTVIMDTASMTLRLYRSLDINIEAPYAAPHTLDLTTLFAGFPE